jgi:ribose transport system permease protein
MSTKLASKKIKLTRDGRQNIVIILAFIAMLALFGSLSEYFLTKKNFITLLNSAVPLGLIAIGQCYCLLTGAFDMSVGMTASFAGIIWTRLITDFDMPIYVAFAIGLAFGIVSGLINGCAVAHLKMPAWIATYATMQMWQGVIYIITEGEAVRMTKYKAFKWLGQHKCFGTSIPPAVLIMIGLFILAYFVLKYTKLGRDLYIIGGNIEAAKNTGIRIKRGQMFVFTVSGFMAALAGLLFASRSGSGQPIIGDQYAMQAIAGTVIGGTAMTGGKANIAMTFIGVMMVVCLQNGLIMAGVPAFYQHIATGAAVVLAIWVQTERKK